MNAMNHLWLAILLHSFSSILASQAKSAMKILPTGDALQEPLANRNVPPPLDLSAGLGSNRYGNFAPGNAAQPLAMAPMVQIPPAPMTPMTQMAPMAQMAPAPMVQSGPGATAGSFDLTSFQKSLPLDTGLRMVSDDGVWFSSRTKSTDNKNYDTNSVLSIPLKIYDKITGSG